MKDDKLDKKTVVKDLAKTVQYDVVLHNSNLMLSTTRGFRLFHALLFYTATEWDKERDYIELSYGQVMEALMQDIPSYKSRQKTKTREVISQHLQLVLSKSLLMRKGDTWEEWGVCWQAYYLDDKQKTLKVYPSVLCKKLLEGTPFVRYYHAEFMSLGESKATKLYMLMSHFRDTGEYYVNWGKLAPVLLGEGGEYKYVDKRKSMNGVVVYQWANIQKYVLNPIMKELRPYFKRLKCTQMGSTFVFTWQKEAVPNQSK
jgi:hypothetical protein